MLILTILAVLKFIVKCRELTMVNLLEYELFQVSMVCVTKVANQVYDSNHIDPRGKNKRN